MPPLSPAWSVVTEVCARLLDQLDHPWTLEALARLAGYSPHHLTRCFAEAVGEPPLRYLRRLRLERAAHELEELPELPIAEVGRRAGYAAPEAFSRAFARAFGLPPRAFVRALPPVSAGPRRQAHGPADPPAALQLDPVPVRRGPVGGWGLALDVADPGAIPAAFARLSAARPGPAVLGGLAWPWGWATAGTPGARPPELLATREIDGPAPPGLRRWHTRWPDWQRFRWSGDPAGMGAGCQWVVERWIPQAGLRAAFAPVLTRVDAAGGELWIPVRGGA